MNTGQPHLLHLSAIRAIPALLAAVLMLPMVQGQELNQIGTRPLTPQEIKNYELPQGTRKSAGIPTVGIGDPVYLEVQVEAGTVVTDTTWSLSMAPANATATLGDSPLSLDIPIYNLGDREVATAVSRRLLVPDQAGIYLVSATVTTDSGTLDLSRYITAAKYVGVGTIAGAEPVWPQCALCHEENAAGWADTNHATALIDELNGAPGNHFQAFCLDCHTIGYNLDPAADSDGFDDIAEAVGWTFPTEAGDHWDDMPFELKQKSNVQCEACHGPGSEHFGQIAQNQTSVSTSAGDCAQCHDSEPYHEIVSQWNRSRHAVATRYPTGEGRESCVRCHSGIGFIQYTDDVEITLADYEAITCQVCHDPHSGENHHQLREVDVLLQNGATVTDGGNGRLCMNCHQSRYDAETRSASYQFRPGPHHGPQADMLAGTNAVEYGMAIGSTGHLGAIEDSCVTCHMQESSEAGNEAGQHTFKITWNAGTPDEEGDDVPLTAACVNCHGEVPGFNIARQDYDGDGSIEGIQDEVHGLMDILAMALPPEGQPTIENSSSFSLAQNRALFNYKFVEEDQSMGVHNTKYTVGILKASIADVMVDDEDGDGLPDGWEIFHFGNITAQGAQGDADGDGILNGEEYAQKLDPTSVDSDGDGWDDKSELLAGYDPLDANRNPGTFEVDILPAVEFLFYTDSGTMYQIQATDDLHGTWEDVGDPIAGGDDIVQAFFSMTGKEKEYYRVREVQ